MQRNRHPIYPSAAPICGLLFCVLALFGCAPAETRSSSSPTAVSSVSDVPAAVSEPSAAPSEPSEVPAVVSEPSAAPSEPSEVPAVVSESSAAPSEPSEVPHVLPSTVPPPSSTAAPASSCAPSESTAQPSATETPVTGAAILPTAPSKRATQLTVRATAAPGTAVESGGGASIDYSNCAEGYLMIKYDGANPKVKIQLTGPNAVTYTYDLTPKKGYEAFPLTAGNGSYNLSVFEQVTGSQYAIVHSATLSVTLNSSLLPYLYPSQYVNFNATSTAVAKGEELAASADTELKVVEKIYNYVTTNITYDDNKAATVSSGYLPSIDSTLSTKKGICFDYAALMASMLRTQNIPTRLEVGYVSGGIYHAWVSVYLSEIGWVNGMIQFDGKTWKLMDPTFASNGNSSSKIMQFIGNGSNYSLKYVY